MRRTDVRVISGVRVRVILLKRTESVLAIARDYRRIHENMRRVLRTIEAEEGYHASEP